MSPTRLEPTTSRLMGHLHTAGPRGLWFLQVNNMVHSVTPNFSLGGEVFWAGQQHMSGLGYGARYNTDKMVATGQIATTGMVALGYVQKVSEKVSLASDLMYNYMSREATASFGYDYMLHQILVTWYTRVPTICDPVTIMPQSGTLAFLEPRDTRFSYGK
ncbi:mitochondrial import receptor subunit TOM40-1-like protein [Tanacetum coccineum]